MFPALLRVERERGDRARFEALDADFLAGFFAVAVLAVLDATNRVLEIFARTEGEQAPSAEAGGPSRE